MNLNRLTKKQKEIVAKALYHREMEVKAILEGATDKDMIRKYEEEKRIIRSVLDPLLKEPLC